MSEKIVRVRLEGDTSDIDRDLLRVKEQQKAVRQEQNKIYTESIYTYTQVAQLGSMLLHNIDLGFGGLVAQQVLLGAQTMLTIRRLILESTAAFADQRYVAGTALAGLAIGTEVLYTQQLALMAETRRQELYMEGLAVQIEQWSP